ncbi:MAG: class I SAM-dependent methyltransferase [Phycisphaerales bacterium JB063]
MTQRIARKTATEQTWDANPAGWSHAPDDEVGTRRFFERAYRARLDEEIPFIKTLIPWGDFTDKQVLEIGCGAGFDAFHLCEHGAVYWGIDYAPKNPGRARRHLAHFGHHPPLMRSDGERLPFADASFEVVFSNGVLHHTPDMPAAFREAQRVLEPGGSFWVVLYHRHSAHYWLSIVLSEWLLKGGFLRRTLAQQRSRIEQTGAGVDVLVDVYSRGELKRILHASGFELRGLWVRKLPGRDLPGYRVLRHVYRFAPRWLARWCEHRFGWYITAHAVKVEHDG